MGQRGYRERGTRGRAARCAPGYHPAVPTRRRGPFWFFVLAMAVALAGGLAIVVLARRSAAERQLRYRAPAPAEPAR
ncbi:hypothetical protein AnaeK_1296 [Anaeromyxobacter sp. K]|uniref:Uncharacterized protein n=1 Tax=Anaeromyxobacter dehalogenans (strain ATCC BAA-258 / DSM 21875 / 2CP-1) TaxID=455488 RepID=B8JH39_ANAD2|nr:hypothetical protein AnaeK_1296 [Anaeromyxobacter sp. K]ACL64741.1 conserved hypothetical protein [Anaeromyxobacter dehalogenans 2CP-1]